jgi:hypothetical protein
MSEQVSNDAMSEMFRRLRKIEGDLDSIRAMLGERCVMRQKILDDYDDRLRELEKSEHKRKGGLAVLATMLTLAASAGAALMKLLGN